MRNFVWDKHVDTGSTMALPWVMPAAQHWHSLPATVLRGYHIPRLWIGTCLFNTNIPCGKQREKLHKPESTSCFMPDFMAIHRV
jgi:hypothetical protein